MKSVAASAKEVRHPKDLLFADHATAFLRILPVVRSWSRIHTNALRSTVNKHLLPRFANRTVNSITVRDAERLEQELRTNLAASGHVALSSFRAKSIRRVLQQILNEPNLGDVTQGEVHSVGPQIPRKEQEDRHWRTSLAAFKLYWDGRTSDIIPNNHALQCWVSRQRKHYKNGSLQPWKLEILKSIDFPFESATAQKRLTNLDYAKRLVEFFKLNGHYAPTITIGGAGLTKWVYNMRLSGGAIGLRGRLAGPVGPAMSHLRTHIDGFAWSNTCKAEVNQSQGKTFNGYDVTAPKALAHFEPVSTLDVPEAEPASWRKRERRAKRLRARQTSAYSRAFYAELERIFDLYHRAGNPGRLGHAVKLLNRAGGQILVHTDRCIRIGRSDVFRDTHSATLKFVLIKRTVCSPATNAANAGDGPNEVRTSHVILMLRNGSISDYYTHDAPDRTFNDWQTGCILAHLRQRSQTFTATIPGHARVTFQVTYPKTT